MEEFARDGRRRGFAEPEEDDGAREEQGECVCDDEGEERLDIGLVLVQGFGEGVGFDRTPAPATPASVLVKSGTCEQLNAMVLSVSLLVSHVLVFCIVPSLTCHVSQITQSYSQQRASKKKQ